MSHCLQLRTTKLNITINLANLCFATNVRVQPIVKYYILNEYYNATYLDDFECFWNYATISLHFLKSSPDATFSPFGMKSQAVF